MDFLSYLNNYNSYFLYFDFCAQSSKTILGYQVSRHMKNQEKVALWAGKTYSLGKEKKI